MMHCCSSCIASRCSRDSPLKIPDQLFMLRYQQLQRLARSAIGPGGTGCWTSLASGCLRSGIEQLGGEAIRFKCRDQRR